MAMYPGILSQWQCFHSIWTTGSLCWDWKSLLLARCCSATPCLHLHMVPIREVRGVGRRREQVEQDDPWRSQPADPALAPVEAPLVSEEEVWWMDRSVMCWWVWKELDEVDIWGGPGGPQEIPKQSVPGNNLWCLCLSKNLAVHAERTTK